jgi:excisionase family DNA binding protein
MATRPGNPALLTREQAATYLGVRPQTLAVWASAKRYGLPLVKVGRSVRYRVADLERWLAARTVGGANGQGEGGPQ